MTNAFAQTQASGYVVEECLFSLLVQFDCDVKFLHQILDLLLALLQVLLDICSSFVAQM